MNKYTLNLNNECLTVITDTNGLIGILEHPGALKRTLELFNGKSVKIVILTCVLKEIKRIRDYSTSEVLSQVSSLLHSRVSVLRANSDIKTVASQLESKYTQAHFPDSLLVACAVICSFAILSYDHGLLYCAKNEGVRTFTPKFGVNLK